MEKVLLLILFFIVGTVFGSFCNVVGFRLAKKESIVKPRSHCPKCGHVLGFLELIPVVSYLFLRGKCKKCHEHISLFYPVVELFTGILFMISFYSFGFSYDLLIALALSLLFAIVVVTDLNYYIIPDEVNIFFAIVVIIINIFRFGSDFWRYTLYGLAMFLFMYLLMLLGNLIFKQESLGGGDIKLLFVLGMVMPLIMSFFGIALASFLALPISCYFYVKNKDKIVPFGPFLVAAFLILFLTKVDPSEIYNFILLK